MITLWDIDLDALELGPIEAAMSGADARFIKPAFGLVQTPWMLVNKVNTYENGKTSITLDVDSETREWVEKLDAAAQSMIPEKTKDVWTPCITYKGWRLNIPASCKRFGIDIEDDTMIAAVVEIIGVWFWSGKAGLKTKVVQIKTAKVNSKEPGS